MIHPEAAKSKRCPNCGRRMERSDKDSWLCAHCQEQWTRSRPDDIYVWQLLSPDSTRPREYVSLSCVGTIQRSGNRKSGRKRKKPPRRSHQVRRYEIGDLLAARRTSKKEQSDKI